ncbi:unnamed protein product, partial [Larinioides sclopetarius]
VLTETTWIVCVLFTALTFAYFSVQSFHLTQQILQAVNRPIEPLTHVIVMGDNEAYEVKGFHCRLKLKFMQEQWKGYPKLSREFPKNCAVSHLPALIRKFYRL